tara:strand:+ start:10232 stop:10684 length:453 start_codon:yes stop_codon:yes gene_type:complete
MIFKGIRNQFLELKIIGYELPENFGPSYEANFLVIELNVASDLGNWQTDGCALSTTDVEKIIDWFYKLGEHKSQTQQLSFMEKGISFELINNNTVQKQVRALLYSECLPQNAVEGKQYYVDLDLNHLELKEVSESLQKELNLFPSRGFEE